LVSDILKLHGVTNSLVSVHVDETCKLIGYNVFSQTIVIGKQNARERGHPHMMLQVHQALVKPVVRVHQVGNAAQFDKTFNIPAACKTRLEIVVV
jgi:hypothetical protein